MLLIIAFLCVLAKFKIEKAFKADGSIITAEKNIKK